MIQIPRKKFIFMECIEHAWYLLIIILKATGGGAFKFADLFKEKLDISFDKVDEMDCLVTGANYLLKVGF